MKCAFKGCSRKLQLHEILLKCKCHQSFCKKHSFFKNHACDVDYVKLGAEQRIVTLKRDEEQGHKWSEYKM